MFLSPDTTLHSPTRTHTRTTPGTPHSNLSYPIATTAFSLPSLNTISPVFFLSNPPTALKLRKIATPRTTKLRIQVICV
ncbi:hypothetical protein BB559_004433 [Furculomyces boomerangus]|uniref:Uncharacterized protein n=1 Tax=Furculomyces boomerangus TaxID=61424 RepID=A0A2T9YES6_9FUNG|nr:hypothetical protein BB559_004433 [Furculomyces boomerangus]